MAQLTSEALAYFAGFIDGEGSFGYYTTPRLAITNTYLPVLKELQAAFGGTWAMRGNRSPEVHRTCYAWTVSGGTALKAIEALLPYLREKQAQAQILLDIQSYPAQSAMRKALLRRLSELKRVDQHDDDPTG